MSRSTLILLVVISASLTCASDAQDNRTSAQTLSPEVTIYETYRRWHTMLPADEQDAPDVLDRYRAHLLASGTTPTQADTDIKVIAEQGAKLEVARWNRILTAENPRFNTQANSFLVERIKGLSPGKALDVGMGQGRNAIYLAQLGWDVTGFDIANEAVALAQREAQRRGVKLNAIVADAAEFDWGTDRWDLIVLSYVAVRENASRVIRALKPGGLVIIEGAHRDATKTQSIGSAVVFGNNELIELFPGFRVLRYEDELGIADFGGRVEARLVRLCAQKVE